MAATTTTTEAMEARDWRGQARPRQRVIREGTSAAQSPVVTCSKCRERSTLPLVEPQRPLHFASVEVGASPVPRPSSVSVATQGPVESSAPRLPVAATLEREAVSGVLAKL